MQIQNGKLYENRTWKYLYPCLNYYGEELMSKLSTFFKLAVGINDHNKREKEQCIYILVDTNIPLLSDKDRQNYKNKFSKFLSWVSYKYYYVSDYPFDDNKHMVVLKIPRDFNTSYVHFVKGNYSQMYTTKSLNNYFKYINISNKELEIRQNKKMKVTRSVLSKDSKYVSTFVNIVNHEFKSDATVEDFKDAELDFPPKKEEEIFNYKEEFKEAIAS